MVGLKSQGWSRVEKVCEGGLFENQIKKNITRRASNPGK